VGARSRSSSTRRVRPALRDLQYIAGLFDGEGTICSKSDGSRLTVGIQIVNTDEAVIRWVHETMGIGGVYRQRGTNMPIWQWQCTLNDSMTALHWLLPYLRVKKPHAIEALKITPSMSGHSTSADEKALRLQVRTRLRELNSYGKIRET